MSSIVKIKYDARTLSTTIVIDGKLFDTSKINGKPLEEFAYPFKKNSTIWYGLQKEITNITNSDDIEIEFDGDPASLEELKAALPNVKINSGASANLVVVIYNQAQLTTRIIVNGKPVDTSKIQNRAFEEIIVPITIAEIGWRGIFAEIEDALESEEYTIQFLGDAHSMLKLVEVCPDTVNVVHKAAPPKKASPLSNVAASATKDSTTTSSSSPSEQNLGNIPIKNKFVRENIQAICAGLILVFCLLPFAKLTSSVHSEYVNEEASAKASGFTSVFSSHGTILGLILLLIPVLIIALNYIKPLRPYRRPISIFCPLAGVVIEIITFISLKSKLKGAISIEVEDESARIIYTISPQIGFFLVMIMFIVTGIVGYITYYGLKIPSKKK